VPFYKEYRNLLLLLSLRFVVAKGKGLSQDLAINLFELVRDLNLRYCRGYRNGLIKTLRLLTVEFDDYISIKTIRYKLFEKAEESANVPRHVKLVALRFESAVLA